MCLQNIHLTAFRYPEHSYFGKLGICHRHIKTLHLTVIFTSLTYIKNNKRPRIDPCGTRHGMFETSENEFSKFTVNLRFDR